MANNAGWLQISTEGFASFNQARPPGHLVKELVQNAFDAIGEHEGTVSLTYRHDGQHLIVECNDTGSGIDDLSTMWVVYLTFKTDSHLKRGRFGRGFKEILSVARSAVVVSGNREFHFLIENGQQTTREATRPSAHSGTAIWMEFNWPPESVAEFDTYFDRFIVPGNVTFTINGRPVEQRHVDHVVDAQLTTEIYDTENHSWRKPRRKTVLEVIEADEDEEAHIYEMGIPVAPAEWTLSFHVNVLQRVPMNPNRDALATGYAKRIHKACLPVLLPELDAENITADWVGAAGAESAPDVQKEILTKAFAKKAVRSVPPMGKRDFDHDAERIGSNIVKTSQMSSGFREMAKEHLPSAKEAVKEAEVRIATHIARESFNASNLTAGDRRLELIKQQGGRKRVNTCLDFAVWFCQQLVDSTGDTMRPVTGNLAIGGDAQWFDMEKSEFMAYWSEDNQLTLALDVDCFWDDPLGAEALSILVHEAAHARNMHHGKGFHSEVERLAGVAAEVMFEQADEIRRRWSDLTFYEEFLSLPKRGWFRWLAAGARL